MTDREVFMTRVLGCRRLDLYVRPRPLTPEEDAALAGMEERRRSGEPLQYIVGECEFMGLSLQVDPRVLIPRPETEILVDSAVQRAREQGSSLRPWRVLDVGTGSGNIALALARELPAAQVTALDISPDALVVARANAVQNGLAGRVRFVLAGLAEFWASSAAGDSFDLVISNPPYIPTAQLAFLPPDVQQEPWSALDGGPDGLYYLRQIVKGGASFLRPGGLLFLEVGDGQARTVGAMFPAEHFSPAEFIKDYVGTERVVWARRKDPGGG